MHARPDWVWSLAKKFKLEANRKIPTRKIDLVQNFLRLEFGETFPLVDLVTYGVGVHHAGLSDEVRALMEWLFEEDELRFLVATTTIAQGVNFPVSGVVMASHQYPINTPPFWVDMPRRLLEYRRTCRKSYFASGTSSASLLLLRTIV